MKKVLHMTPADVNSGVYRYVFNNLEYINRNDYVFGFLTRAAENLRKTDEYRKFQFNIHPFFSTQRDNPKGLEEEVRKVLKEYDIIHLHTSSWRGFMIEQVAMELGMEKVIVHSHSTGIDIPDLNERAAQIKEHIAYREQFSEKYATDFCACSKGAAEWLFGKAIPQSKIKYMPNAIKTCKYKYDEHIRENVRKRLNIYDKFVIGHVGRYSYTKNQAFLIECLREIKKEVPNAVLICIGQGELKENYQELVKRLQLEDSVLLLDWQNDIEKYLQAFDMFCLPSKFEGLPISAIEAQAAGLPCLISSDVTREIAITDLVEFCPCELETWIKKIICQSESKNGNRYGYDLKVAQKGYDIEQSARMLEKLYGE